jgi:hypothetical protein
MKLVLSSKVMLARTFILYFNTHSLFSFQRAISQQSRVITDFSLHLIRSPCLAAT